MTTQEQERFDRIEDDRRRRERVLLEMLLALSAESESHARAAVRIGYDPATSIRDVWLGNDAIEQDGAGVIVAEQMGLAYATGVRRAYRMAGVRFPDAAGESDATGTVLPAPEAVTLDPVFRTRKFSAVGNEIAQSLAEAAAVKVDQELAAAQELSGTKLTIRAWRRSIRRAFDGAGLKEANPYTLETQAERAVLEGYNAGLWDGYQSPAVASELVALRHRSVIDEGTTPICRERNGLTLAKDHPYWRNGWPSLHYRCRSVVLPVYDGEPHELSHWLPTVPPMAGFGRAPLTAFGHIFT